MIRVAVSCARWLGVHCLYELHRHPGVEIVAVHVPEPGSGWWNDVNEAAEAERLGISPYFSAPPPSFSDILFSILSPHIFRAFPLGGINLHPAPLPEYRGCNSYAHAIINNDPLYAATLHYMDAGIDTGPIIGQEWLPIDRDETGLSLYWKAQCAALTLFKRELPGIVEAAEYGARVPALPQDESKARYYPRTSLDDKSLWGLSPAERHRKRRALTFPPFPPAQEAPVAETVVAARTRA